MAQATNDLAVTTYESKTSNNNNDNELIPAEEVEITERVIAMLDEMVPNKVDQRLLIDLARNKRWDTLEQYYKHLKLQRDMYFKIEAVINHLSLSSSRIMLLTPGGKRKARKIPKSDKNGVQIGEWLEVTDDFTSKLEIGGAGTDRWVSGEQIGFDVPIRETDDENKAGEWTFVYNSTGGYYNISADFVDFDEAWLKKHGMEDKIATLKNNKKANYGSSKLGAAVTVYWRAFDSVVWWRVQADSTSPTQTDAKFTIAVASGTNNIYIYSWNTELWLYMKTFTSQAGKLKDNATVSGSPQRDIFHYFD